jgi:hypothetical protein
MNTGIGPSDLFRHPCSRSKLAVSWTFSILRVEVLIDESGDWCALMRSGAHRVAAAAALEVEMIPLRIDRLIHRSDAPVWPGVTSGEFSLEDALGYSDSVLAGSPPTCLDAGGLPIERWMVFRPRPKGSAPPHPSFGD